MKQYQPSLLAASLVASLLALSPLPAVAQSARVKAEVWAIKADDIAKLSKDQLGNWTADHVKLLSTDQLAARSRTGFAGSEKFRMDSGRR
jgi:hypothetical protein